MTNAQQFSLLVGAFLPFVLAIILREHWSESVKSIVAFVVCILAGLAASYVNHQLTGLSDSEAVITDVLLVLGMAYGTYREFWKPTGIAAAVNITMPYKIVRESSPAVAPIVQASPLPANGDPSPPSNP